MYACMHAPQCETGNTGDGAHHIAAVLRLPAVASAYVFSDQDVLSRSKRVLYIYMIKYLKISSS